jgi:hypothetical protein
MPETRREETRVARRARIALPITEGTLATEISERAATHVLTEPE